MDLQTLQRISDRAISLSDLRSEVLKLTTITEPPTFWLAIAGDPTYSAPHRAVAICEFFRRHVKLPVNVVDLANLLHNPDWIVASSVTVVDHLKGEIPVEWNVGETVLALRPFYRGAEAVATLYLRFSQRLDADSFVRIVRGADDISTAIGAQLLEAACSE